MKKPLEALKAYQDNLPKELWPEDLVRFEERVLEIKRELMEGKTDLNLSNGMKVRIGRKP